MTSTALVIALITYTFLGEKHYVHVGTQEEFEYQWGFMRDNPDIFHNVHVYECVEMEGVL